VLLAEKSHAIQYLPRSGAGRFEPALEIGILLLETVHSFRIHSRPSGRRIDCLDACFRRKRATPESRKLIAEMSDELVQLLKRFDVRTFAV
jgi:hypothetical protein